MDTPRARPERVDLSGLSSPADVLWDRWGVPHIFAASVEDAYRALGFVSGHERLWQMELARLIARGRAASVLGPQMLWSDVAARAFDLCADRAGVVEAPGDPLVSAYLDGVNAYVDGLDARPPEFESADTDPSHFTLADVAARQRHQTWYVYQGWLEKIALARVIAAHGIDRWRDTAGGLTDEDVKVAGELTAAYAALDPRVGMLTPSMADGGSNNWVVSGRRTPSGAALVASDPHLPLSVPCVFFLAHLEAPGLSVTGATLPGTGVFLIGHTRHVGWSVTVAKADNDELFIEELHPEDPSRYRAPDGWAPFETRDIDIEVRGQAPHRLTVRRTHNGVVTEPLLDSLGVEAPPRTHVTSLRWSTGEVATPASAMARVPLARNVEEFGEYLLEGGPTPLCFNVLCGDRDGGVGRWLAKHLPRRRGVSGALPLPGWQPGRHFDHITPEEQWVERDPERGFLATANHDTTGPLGADPGFVAHTYPMPDTRASRIFEVLSGDATVTLRDCQELQLDLLDPDAREMIPALLSLLPSPRSETQRRALAMLEAWDRRATTESAGACVYYVLCAMRWWEKAAMAVLEAAGQPPMEVKLLRTSLHLSHRLPRRLLLDDRSPWHAHRSVVADVVADVLERTMASLSSLLGPDPDAWRWGDLHTVTMAHTLAGQEPFAAQRVGPEPIAGAGHTLAVAGYLGRGPYTVYLGSVLRMVCDLADPEHARWVLCSGNSGRPSSVHGTDHFPLWLSGQYLTLDRERADVEARAEARWRLEPTARD